MPGVVRKGDKCSGHGCYPPRPASKWSPNVFANGRNVERRTDTLESHCCDGCHTGVYEGVHTVFANNLDVQVQGDPIDCGSKCDEHSPNVFVE